SLRVTSSGSAISTDHLIEVRSSRTEPDLPVSSGPAPSSMPPPSPGSGTFTVSPGIENSKDSASVYVVAVASIHQVPPTFSLPATESSRVHVKVLSLLTTQLPITSPPSTSPEPSATTSKEKPAGMESSCGKPTLKVSPPARVEVAFHEPSGDR